MSRVPQGTTLHLFDGNDNVTKLKEKDGAITFVVDQSPQYLEGLTADAEITLGESDHSDAQPGQHARKIGNLGDGSWTLVEKSDEEYKTNKPTASRTFSRQDVCENCRGADSSGAKALAIHLEKQDKDRGVMPFFTTLLPKKPIVIPGKATHLGMWVHAASDWGRFVYVLRDAKGEKWSASAPRKTGTTMTSIAGGAFCFDGWRYLRFQLPASAP